MAGRILPIALAGILGISIGIATFDGEFKEQRKRRLEKEYQRELAAATSTPDASAPLAPSAVAPTVPEQSPFKVDEVKASEPSSSSWSSMLGLWAWKKDTNQTTMSSTTATAPPKDSIAESKGKP
ncbi:hypothetical protein T440DRAFT_470804 [Plenodomus tracheiphilus IPT5]|uniref:Uncharacterized protein n=1 Tax=Plenodomus tracheiphilus IPT5 TaxID=1408161 RepID=A0A6A7AXC9_9PLEO|nr:hypothetical protein T440DRAFT_470804 [Plenodomus tracheiphilus IPT5]